MIVEIFRDRKKQFRFSLKSRNGRIIAQSEGYTRKQSIKNLIGTIENAIMDGRKVITRDLS